MLYMYCVAATIAITGADPGVGKGRCTNTLSYRWLGRADLWLVATFLKQQIITS